MYRKESNGWLKHIDFIVADIICLQISYILSYAAAGYGFHTYSLMIYRNMAIFLGLADLIILLVFDTMKNILKRGHYQELLMTIRHVFLVIMAAVLYLFLLQQGQKFSRLTLILLSVFYTAISYSIREIWKKALTSRRVDDGKRSLLIVTTEKMAKTVIANINGNNYARYILAGLAIIDRDMTGATIEGVPVVSDTENLPMYICQQWVDEVFVVTSGETPYPGKLIDKIAETGVVLHINLSGVLNLPGEKHLVEKIGNYTVLTSSMNYASARQLFAKRVMDIVVGSIGCLATCLIFLFVAPAIYISSPGPVFFSQERVGKNGKTFKMYKFRSMYMDAEERKAELMKDNKLGDGKMFKMDFDPRVIGNKILPDGTKKTGIGDFIRRTSLDEFPQFFNVLKGDMSVVGTRPPLIGEVSLYEPHHRARLAIKPGITGMWQVSGRSDITDFEEVVRLDKEYISRWSLGLDIKILAKTVLVVFKGEGSV